MNAALERELDLAEAADLARNGDYATAITVLERSSADDPARLDLLARVYAQSGDLDKADEAWAEVLQIRPGDSAAEAGRRVIAKVRSGRLRRRPIRRYLLAAGAVVLIGAAATAGVLTIRPTPAVTTAKPDDGLKQELDRLHSAESSNAKTRQDHRAELEKLARRLTKPGVTAKAEEDAVAITFEKGLFNPNATTPNQQGREALDQWAEVLKGQPVAVTVIGHGVPVAGGPASGGSTVSLTRAASAARILAEASGLPLTTFAISSADQSTSVHADPEANRTVTLQVRPT
ncbi:tetratricopeptide repeat protein [Amycolatopsis jejuensis]|uniref:tetratricopeptide repeat protein n=1 Tax=Amycolatopsis jejuensis TaxID=330084 RepID=UPI000524AF13|nr:tetratricopeptide repeat protein [Amycolatopsis jejuensis]